MSLALHRRGCPGFLAAGGSTGVGIGVSLVVVVTILAALTGAEVGL